MTAGGAGPGAGNASLPGGQPMDCGIYRPFRAGGERKVLRRETGVLAAHFVAAAGGVFSPRGRRHSAGPGGGRLKVGEPENQTDALEAKTLPGEGRPTRRRRRCVLGGRQLPRHVLKAGQRTGGIHPPGKRGSSLGRIDPGVSRVIIDRPLGGTEEAYGNVCLCFLIQKACFFDYADIRAACLPAVDTPPDCRKTGLAET